MKFVFTDHARARMLERDVDIENVRRTVRSPDETRKDHEEKIIATKEFDDGRALTVIYKQDQRKIIIVSTYYKDAN